MTDFAKPISKLASRQVQVDPHPGQGIALDHLSLIPVNALGSGTTATNVFLAGDRSWRTVAGGGGAGDGGVGIVASNTTWTAGTITISGFGAATVNTAASLVRISVPVQTAQTGISGIAASNTTYTSGTVTITGVAGGVGITVSSNTGQRIDLSVGDAVQFLVATNTTYSHGSVTITGSNMVTVKSSALGQGIIIDATQTVQTQSNIQGIAASNTTYNTGTVSFTGVGGGITVSSNTGQRVDLSVAAQSVQTQLISPTLDYWDNAAGQWSSGIGGGTGIGSLAHVFNTLLVAPMSPFVAPFPGQMTASTAMVQFSVSATASSSHSSTVAIGIYTRQNATRLSLLNSVQTTWAQAAATNQTASYHGQRWLTIHSSLWSSSPAFSEGQYYMAMFIRSSNASHTGSFLGQFAQMPVQRSGSIMSSAATGTTMGHSPFLGVLSVSTTGIPATIAWSDLNKVGSTANFVNNLVFNNITGSF